MHRYFKLVQELSQKEMIMNNKSKIQSYISAYSQAKQLRKHHKQIITKYDLGTINSLAQQYQQNVLMRKNNKLFQQYQQIVEKRVRSHKINETTEFLKDITKGISLQSSNLYSLNQKPLKEYAEEQLANLKSKFQFKKYLDPKEIILVYQYYHSKVHEILLGYVKLYHESVQNLLEGKREVMQKEDFKFEDGQTVKDKMNKLEESLKSKMTKFRKNKNIK